MRLLEPWWLVLLGPWVGLVVLALRQYRPKVLVPYLDLWPREEERERERRRGWRPPGWPVGLLLLAMLLGVVGLARPVWVSERPMLKKVTVVVDRGVTMLAGERGRKAADRAMEVLRPLLGEESEIRVVDTLGGDRLVPRGQLGEVLHEPATAADTRERVRGLVERAEGVTVLLSDMGEVGPQVVQISPEGAVRNVGIVRAAVAGGECLVKVRNETELREVGVRVDGMGQRVELPMRGQSREYVFPVAGDAVHVQLEVSDDLGDDNEWWVLSGRARPRLTVSAAVPQGVRRFAAAYGAARTGDGEVVQIVAMGEAAGERSVIVAPTDRLVAVPRVVGDHSILRNVRLPEQVMATSRPLPEGEWKALLAAGDAVLLAVDEARRRVWVGMELPEESPEAVVLWMNVVEYVGGEAGERSGGPRKLDASWRRVEGELPAEINGLRAGGYERGGEKVAVCVPAPVFGEARGDGEAEQRLRAIAGLDAQVPVWPWLWMMAAGMVVGAAGMTNARAPISKE